MKTLRKLFVIFGLSALVFVALPATPAYAAPGGCTANFLTFPAWYRGLVNSDCSIKSPNDVGGISSFIFKIVLNVVEIMLQLVAYISVGFVMYGGFLYLASAGSADKIAAGKKTILNALIGLVLSFFSVAIVALIAENIG